MKRQSFPRKDRLRSRKTIAALFASGNHVFHYPFKFVFAINPAEEPTPPLQIAVSVPKRRFKSAVKRNLIRRRTKEAYRTLKSDIFDAISEDSKHYAGMIIYVGQEIEPYSIIEPAVKNVLQKFLKKVIKS